MGMNLGSFHLCSSRSSNQIENMEDTKVYIVAMSCISVIDLLGDEGASCHQAMVVAPSKKIEN